MTQPNNTAIVATDFTDVQYLEQMANHYASSPVPEIRAHQKRLRAIAAALAAAPAQPTPPTTQAWPIAPDVAADLERSDWTPEEALRWYAAGKHYDTVPNGDGSSSARILDNGAVASNALKSLSREYAKHKGDVALQEPAPVVGTIAHVGTGKTTLTGAIASALRAAPVEQPDTANAALPDDGEPWHGHRFKEVQHGCWKCDCGKTLKEVTADQAAPATGDEYPLMPRRYTVDDDGEDLFTAEKMRAFADATHALRLASCGQALRLLTQAERDSLGRRAEGMDGNEWDQLVQEKFAQVNGLRVQGGSYEWD